MKFGRAWMIPKEEKLQRGGILMVQDIIKNILIERTVGSENNSTVLLYLEKQLEAMGYDIQKLPFLCTTWETKNSYLKLNERIIGINASPFSEPCDVCGNLAFAKSLEELKGMECQNNILILGGDLVSSPLQPKNYPFYYPDEHRNLIELLEKKQPAAIIAATGKHPLCGLEPFPLFEDGNFLIPSAYISENMLTEIQNSNTQSLIHISIQSKKIKQNSYQLVAKKKAKKTIGKIVICAHMDSKYNTLGALDNAVGIAVLLEAARKLNSSIFDIDIVPFNGEEYYEASGEVEYLKFIDDNQDKIFFVVNIDSPCHVGSEIAVSLYNLKADTKKLINCLMGERQNVVYGPEWYAGDHAAFAFRGIPCIVLSSSDLFDGALNATHTMKDNIQTVDLSLIEYAADYINDFISVISQKDNPIRCI